MDTSSKTTQVPRKPGLYLFVGEVYFPRQMTRNQHVEVIRVATESTGRLMWIGKDFYEPDELIGVWLNLEEPVAALQQEADDVFVERAAVDLVPGLFTYGSTLYDLPKKLARECDLLADRVLARAVELGVVEDRGSHHMLLKGKT